MKIRILYLFLFLITLCSNKGFGQQTFKEKQMTYSRVKTAYDEKYQELKKELQDSGININGIEIFITVYKLNKEVVVWARNRGDDQFTKYKTFKICSSSGTVGPKRRQGDLQVPEGFYFIEIFNPWSNFYLSLGINYPNSSDRILGVKGNLGGDIYIHGSCVTIGCIPITDFYIKELYVLCVEAKNNGQEKIPVFLFPAELNKGIKDKLINEYDPDDIAEKLWNELQIAHDFFEINREIPKIQFLKDGSHKISE